MNKHKSNKIKENSNTVRHLIMGQIITTQNLVSIKEVRHAGQQNSTETISIAKMQVNIGHLYSHNANTPYMYNGKCTTIYWHLVFPRISKLIWAQLWWHGGVTTQYPFALPIAVSWKTLCKAQPENTTILIQSQSLAADGLSSVYIPFGKSS